MIEKMLPFQFIKKSPFYGSFQGMNYRIIGKGGELEACAFPGPYNFVRTPEEQKEYRVFAFSEEGYDEAIAWLNEKYEEKGWQSLQIRS